MENLNLKRAANFTKTEEEILVTLVTKWSHVLENKKTDASSSKLKDAAWAKLAQEYNAGSSSYRDVITLRRKYENLKKRSKLRHAEQKLYVKATGGGKPPSPTISFVDEAIKDMLQEQMTGRIPSLDSDVIQDESAEVNVLPIDVEVTMMESNPTPSCSSAAIIATGDVETFEPIQSQATADWSSYTPTMLRTPINVKLASRKRKCSTSSKKLTADEKWSKLADAKLRLLENQKEYLETEHLEKMKIMNEESDFRMKIMNKESDFRMKILQVEYESKIKK